MVAGTGAAAMITLLVAEHRGHPVTPATGCLPSSTRVLGPPQAPGRDHPDCGRYWDGGHDHPAGG